MNNDAVRQAIRTQLNQLAGRRLTREEREHAGQNRRRPLNAADLAEEARDDALTLQLHAHWKDLDFMEEERLALQDQ